MSIPDGVIEPSAGNNQGVYDICEVSIVAQDADWLAGLTRRLIGGGLAATAYLAPHGTIYQIRDGSLAESRGSRVVLHTRVGHINQIVATVANECAHDVPAVVSTPITDGYPGYLQWVRQQTLISCTSAWDPAITSG